MTAFHVLNSAESKVYFTASTHTLPPIWIIFLHFQIDCFPPTRANNAFTTLPPLNSRNVLFFFSDNQNLIHHPLLFYMKKELFLTYLFHSGDVGLTKETFQIWDINIRPCCLQLELCSSRDSKELWWLTCVSDVQWCISHSVYFLFRMHTQTHTHTHTHTHTRARWPWLVSSVISIWSCSFWWSPFITRLSYTAGLAPLLTSTHLTLSLSDSLYLLSFDFPLLSHFPLDLTLSFVHLSLYLTPSFLLFFLPPSLQSMQSLSSSLCSCPRCWSRCTVWASSPTSTPHSTASTVLWVHTHTHTHCNRVKNQIMPINIRFWWRTQRSI